MGRLEKWLGSRVRPLLLYLALALALAMSCTCYHRWMAAQLVVRDMRRVH